MTIRTHYFLTGKPAKIHDLLTAGHRFSHAWRTLPQNTLINRITKLVGLILWALTWPCHQAAQGMEWMFRKPIDPDTYERETEAWKRRFNPTGENCDLRFIELLVRSKIKIRDCPFEHIVACRLSRGAPQSLFMGDGEYSGFTSYFSTAPENCLVLGVNHDPVDLAYFRNQMKDSRAQYAEEVTPDIEADEDSFGFKCQYYGRAKDRPDQVPPKGINKARWVWLWNPINPDQMTSAQREKILQHFK